MQLLRGMKLARCPKCGTVVANAKKTWRMSGRPDTKGNRIELVVGLFDCPKCKMPFREILSKRKTKDDTNIPKNKPMEIKDKEEQYTAISRNFATNFSLKVDLEREINLGSKWDELSANLCEQLIKDNIEYEQWKRQVKETKTSSFFSKMRISLALLATLGFFALVLYLLIYDKSLIWVDPKWGYVYNFSQVLGLIMGLLGGPFVIWFIIREIEERRMFPKDVDAKLKRLEAKISDMKEHHIIRILREVCIHSVLLKGNMNESIALLKQYQENLKHERIRDRVISEINSLLNASLHNDSEKILELSFDVDETRKLLDQIVDSGESDLSRLATSGGYNQKMLQNLVEMAVRKGILRGFLSNDKTVFMTRDWLKQKLSNKLTS
jgi:hypothetical protein